MPTTYTQVLEEIVKLRREAKTSPTHKERLATIMLDIIRCVINHEYEGKLGTKYEVLRQSGTLWHDLLMLSPFWSALLAIDTDMVERFKRLLRRFDLAYPVSRQQKFDTDLIVPTYWKLREISRHRSLSRHESVLDRHYGVGIQVAKWKYSVSVAVSEAIFVLPHTAGDFYAKRLRSFRGGSRNIYPGWHLDTLNCLCSHSNQRREYCRGADVVGLGYGRLCHHWGKNMSSQDMATSSEAQMGFLKKLLTLHNSSFDEFAVSETANLTAKAPCTCHADPSWNSSAVKLDTVDTIEMLRECTLKVWVKQARHFTTWMRNDKVIGQGEKILNGCIPVDRCSSTEVTIPFLPTGTASSLSVVCQVDSHVFRNPTTRIFDE
ncbi:hypothetical protein PC117_g26887 [Phytophthora cactorum]|uniref:Uncharacterized protein n=2 Tax=Phytophthora cactorum TaxID=29920 RepID=A0A8T1AHJ3_9STRA|nr:hypothetical protein PC117_g26887 [Phytophthora cactorum]